jgi:hypothetical protein
MTKSRFAHDDAETLRSKIMRAIRDSNAPVAEVLLALAHCQSHIENTMHRRSRQQD